jgi:hypothetical protein
MVGERSRRLGLATGFAVVILTVLPVGVATAKDGDVIRTGSCSSRSDWKLKLSPEDGRIEVEFEVDQNRVGRTWNVKLKRDGSLLWQGQRTTRAPSGSFEARRVISDRAGRDTIVARATNPNSGEVCRGTATF